MPTARDRFSSRHTHCFGASEHLVHTYLPLVYHNITQWTSVETVSKHCFFYYYYIISLADTPQQRCPLVHELMEFHGKKPETFSWIKKKLFFLKNLYFFISSIILYFSIIICVLRVQHLSIVIIIIIITQYHKIGKNRKKFKIYATAIYTYIL